MNKSNITELIQTRRTTVIRTIIIDPNYVKNINAYQRTTYKYNIHMLPILIQVLVKSVHDADKDAVKSLKINAILNELHDLREIIAFFLLLTQKKNQNNVNLYHTIFMDRALRMYSKGLINIIGKKNLRKILFFEDFDVQKSNEIKIARLKYLILKLDKNALDGEIFGDEVDYLQKVLSIQMDDVNVKKSEDFM